MKRLSLLLVCLLATAGMVQAGSPIKAYTFQKKAEALHVFSEAATTISYIQSGDTLGISNYGFIVFLGENALEKQAKTSGNFAPVTSGLREIGFSFPIENNTFTKFGIGGNGLLYFGNESLTIGHIEENLSGNNWKGSNYFGAYLMTETATGLNRVYDDDGVEHKVLPATVLAGSDTKIQYETVDNVLYVGFEKMHVHDKDGNDRLLATYQYAVEPDGTISLLVGDIVAQEEKSYFLRSVFVSTGTVQCIDFKKEQLDYNNRPTITLGAASSQYSNTRYSMVPPPSCAPIQDFSINWNGKITAPTNQISFAYEFYDTEKATNLLIVLSDSEDPLKSELTDQKTYTDTNKINDFPVRIASSGVATPFSGLKPNTKYWLHVFPYNTNCADGPVYGMEILQPVTTSQSPLDSLSITSINEDTINLSITAGTSRYILGVSNTKIYNYRGNPYSQVLKDSTIHNVGDVVEFRYSENSVTVSADIKILAADATDTTFSMTGAEYGKDYYFYAWAMEGSGRNVRYSFDYVETDGRTATEAPVVLDFTGKEMIETPAGWETSDVDGYKNFMTITYSNHWDKPVFACEHFYPESTTGTASAWAISPWFKGSGYLQAVFNATFYTTTYSQLEGNSPVFSKTINANDSVIFQIQERGQEEWRTIGRVNSESPWSAGFNDIVSEVFSPNSDFRFRMIFYQDARTASATQGGRYFALKSLGVERGSSCLYPIGIMAPEDSMGYRTAKLMWTDPNEGWNNYTVRYREAADENGWYNQRVDVPQVVLSGLKMNTNYVAEINTICSADESSAAKSISFTTARNIVYEQKEFEAANLSELDYLSLQGRPGTELKPLGDGDLGWYIIEDETAPGIPSVASLDRSLTTATDRWLITPILFSGFNSKVKLTVGMSAWRNEGSGPTRERKAATGIDQDTLYIYRSADRGFTTREIVGKVALKQLTTEYQNLEFEFEVETAAPNVFAFYFDSISDNGNEDNESSLGINLIEFEYTEAEFPQVENLRISKVTVSSLTASWEGEAESYAVIYRKRNADKYDTAYTDKTEYVITGLESGTVYSVSVLGYYGADRTLPGPVSREVSSSTASVPTCGTPTGLTSEYDAEEKTVTLSWTPGENNNGDTYVYIRTADVQTYDSVAEPESFHMLTGLKIDEVYYWCVRAVCNSTYLSERSDEAEIKIVANAALDYARDLAIRVNGRQIVVENAAHRFIKTLNVYSATGVLLKSYTANTNGNLLIPTDLNQGMVIIEAVGSGAEKAAVKAIIM